MVKLFQYTNYIDYNELINKPLINKVVVEGDKSLADYGIQPAGNYAHLNADYLNRIFKKQNGESLMSYVVRTKMEKAKQLMNETQLNITQISEMVGYDNYSYFATCFKKYEGISAKQYRENRK